MKTNLTISLPTCAAFFFLFAASTFSQTIPAFPGAEGFGTQTTHGRGGEVIVVSNRNDSGPGSLRAACEASGKRIIVFNTSGAIQLSSMITIDDPLCMIAGQSAPGDGICLTGGGLLITTHDVVVRYVRIRPGDGPGHVPEGRDGITIESRKGSVFNIVIDHCSVSWAIDENIGVYNKYETTREGDISDVTIQWCIVSECLHNSLHPKGGHSKGILYGGGAVRNSLHHNVIAHNHERNPLYQTGATADIVNNIIHNGPGGIGYTNQGDWTARGFLNIVGNRAIEGNNSANKYYVISLNGDYTDYPPKVYMHDNLGQGRTDDGQDQWDAMHVRNLQESDLRTDEPALAAPAVTTFRASHLLDSLLPTVGAWLPNRDAVDKRIVAEVKNGAAGNRSASGSLIDSPDEAGGYPDYPAENRTTGYDTDNDGMADTWEEQHGLNTAEADHNGHDLHAAYTNLEIYLQFLAGDIPSESEPPTVAFTRPTETVVTEPADLGVVAEATAPGGSIDNVKLYLDNTFVRQENNAPYEWGTAGATAADSALLGLTAGTYTLRLTATDTNGKTASDTMEITVEPGVVGVRKDALRLSPVAAGHAPQVFDLRGRRVVRESVSGNRRKDSHAMSARTHGVFIVRSHRYTTPFARIVSLDQIK